ncbi:methionyl-tRNA formyltransferase [Streptomyces sp. NPDC014983]|uniref:methionyl-tRNA formyltransferase n=1 Tax=Streptomyces sp. NPDC014983 TaxID=3364933 RepID=UPI0036F9C700
MRVVLMSYGAEGFEDLAAACRTAGHPPVAYVCGAPRDGTAADEVLAAMPAGPDLLVPRSPQGLALALAGYEPDVVLCYGFPWRLPASVLRVPRFGVLNVHPSLLPRHRGPMPVHWAVRQGDEETGVTVHWMDEAFDSGPVVACRGGILLPDDLAGDEVFAQVRATIRVLVPEALALAEDGFEGTPQDESRASYEGLMGPESAVIDWTRPAREIHNLVRAYQYGVFPVPGPLAVVRGRWVSVLRTSITWVGGVRMRCGDGPLWITRSVPVPARNHWQSSS